MNKNKSKTLAVRAETVRKLGSSELIRVAGGDSGAVGGCAGACPTTSDTAPAGPCPYDSDTTVTR